MGCSQINTGNKYVLRSANDTYYIEFKTGQAGLPLHQIG